MSRYYLLRSGRKMGSTTMTAVGNPNGYTTEASAAADAEALLGFSTGEQVHILKHVASIGASVTYTVTRRPE